MVKASVYVDGFNLFNGCLRGRSGCQWLDLQGFSREIASQSAIVRRFSAPPDIVNIKYFTTKVRGGNKRREQETYWRALRSNPLIKIIEGRFSSNTRHMKRASPLSGGACIEIDCPKGPNGEDLVAVVCTEEKMTDVNIATELVVDGFRGFYDVAILVTNDSDLCGPIKAVCRDLGKHVVVVRPVGNSGRVPSRSLEQSASSVFDIQGSRMGIIMRNQYPQLMTDERGDFCKPFGW